MNFLTQALPWLTLLVFGTLASYGAFSGGMWGGVGIGFGLLMFFGTARLDGRWPRPAPDVMRLALLALAVIALLNLFSSTAGQSWYDWTRLVTIFLPLTVLTAPAVQARAYHPYLFPVLIVAAILGAFTLGVELVLDAPVLHIAKGDHAALTSYNRGMSYLVVLALPILAALWVRIWDTPNVKPVVAVEDGVSSQYVLPHLEAAPKRAAASYKRRWAMLRLATRKLSLVRVIPFVLFLLLLLFPAGLTESRASKLALLLAMAVVLAAAVAPRVTRLALNGLVCVLLAWPWVVQKSFAAFQQHLDRLPPSWRARVEIWDYMSYRIAEHPWLGWGLGSSKSLDFHQPHGELYQMVVTEAAPHPHNVVTQLWVELGMPGLLLGVGFAFLVLRRAARLSPPLVPFALGAFMAALCLSLVAYNFWTDSMFAAFALTGFAFALLDRRLKA